MKNILTQPTCEGFWWANTRYGWEPVRVMYRWGKGGPFIYMGAGQDDELEVENVKEWIGPLTLPNN